LLCFLLLWPPSYLFFHAATNVNRMIWFLAGAGFLLAGLLFLRSFARADPIKMAKWMRYGGACLLLAITAYLAITGRTPVAMLLAGWALWLLRRKPPPTKPEPQAGQTARSRAELSRQEALDILGLNPGASMEDIRAAHKRLMQTCHPDHGGSSYLAARLNAARDVLLS
jgi:hypothetical protein